MMRQMSFSKFIQPDGITFRSVAWRLQEALQRSRAWASELQIITIKANGSAVPHQNQPRWLIINALEQDGIWWMIMF